MNLPSANINLTDVAVVGEEDKALEQQTELLVLTSLFILLLCCCIGTIELMGLVLHITSREEGVNGTVIGIQIDNQCIKLLALLKVSNLYTIHVSVG